MIYTRNVEPSETHKTIKSPSGQTLVLYKEVCDYALYRSILPARGLQDVGTEHLTHSTEFGPYSPFSRYVREICTDSLDYVGMPSKLVTLEKSLNERLELIGIPKGEENYKYLIDTNGTAAAAYGFKVWSGETILLNYYETERSGNKFIIRIFAKQEQEFLAMNAVQEALLSVFPKN